MAKLTGPKCFLDITIGGKDVGRIVLQLDTSKTIKTAENFRELCTGERKYTVDDEGERPMQYKGCHFFRIVSDFMCEGGDFVHDNGTGGRSIYDPAEFEDECFDWQHTGKGDLLMANTGPNTNTSQFFITFVKTDWLNNKNVKFGEVVEGMDVLDEIAKVGAESGEPSKPVVIKDCGELK